MEAKEAPADPTGKILIVLSDSSTFPIEKKDGSITQEESGVFVQELAKPLEQLLDAGFEVTFASPEGTGPNLDPLSTSLMAYLGNYWSKKKDLDLLEKMKVENNFSHPRPFASISDDELQSFDGVFIPGGHAPLADLGDNPDLGRILWHFHKASKPTEHPSATAPMPSSRPSTPQVSPGSPTKGTRSPPGPTPRRRRSRC